MKEQVIRVFASLSFEKRSEEEAVKLKQNDSFYAEDFSKREHNQNVLYGKLAVKNTPRNSKNSYQKSNSKILQNPLGKDSRCRI